MRIFMKKPQSLLLPFLLILMMGFSGQAQASFSQNIYRQEMILMSLYIYGMNQELTRSIPRQDELSFLADSLIEVIQRLNSQSLINHHNFQDLLTQANQIKKSSAKELSSQVKQLIDSCSSCHRAGSLSK